ncbi:ATP-binding protein [Streptomyces sp. KLMMK]|uniref:ATP-binding protein n=1 Tax=Streptomyces sp. KLMMK TaxID=3109353 RepID=UPI002FFECF56
MNALADHHYILHLEVRSGRLPQVERIVTAHLRYWQLEPLMRPVRLGVHELLANVHRHAGPDKRCTLQLHRSGQELTVSLTDRNTDLAALLGVHPATQPGRGLALIAALSDSWGVQPLPDGKTVWFTIRAQYPTAPLPRPFVPRIRTSEGPRTETGAARRTTPPSRHSIGTASSRGERHDGASPEQRPAGDVADIASPGRHGAGDQWPATLPCIAATATAGTRRRRWSI